MAEDNSDNFSKTRIYELAPQTYFNIESQPSKLLIEVENFADTI